ncbi:MAG: biofilm regulation diguanylate cyclase SiaD [Marinobacter sp.]|nr:biofilm regulation diguanylate cyclase SiaD [Marinobacter sp.]
MSPSSNDDSLSAVIADLIEDPKHRDNPLLPALRHLTEENAQQRKRLDKLLRIADGYDNLSHRQNQSLMDRYDRHLRRIEKIARISDLYQRTMVELNDSLRQAALHDALTDLPNRRHISDRLRELTARATRHKQTFSLILLDIDHFKLINDTYGHDTGDRVLCQTADLIQSNLREYDLCARWGGEEFLILLPDASAPEATEIGQRIVNALHSLNLADTTPFSGASDSELTITASAGITSYQQPERYEQTIQRADNAMYQAKAAGRNRVVTINP